MQHHVQPDERPRCDAEGDHDAGHRCRAVAGGCPSLALVQARSAGALECGTFLLANLLDPRLRGNSLTPDQRGKALKHALNFIFRSNFWAGPPPPQKMYAADFASSIGGSPLQLALSAYVAQVGIYGSPIPDNDAELFWRCGLALGFHSGLCDLGLRLAACTASSADVERPGDFMSVWGFFLGIE